MRIVGPPQKTCCKNTKHKLYQQIWCKRRVMQNTTEARKQKRKKLMHQPVDTTEVLETCALIGTDQWRDSQVDQEWLTLSNNSEEM